MAKLLYLQQLQATGKPVEVHNDYRDTSTNTEKELNLHPETRT